MYEFYTFTYILSRLPIPVCGLGKSVNDAIFIEVTFTQLMSLRSM